MSDGEFSAHEQLYLKAITEAVTNALKERGNDTRAYFGGLSPEQHILHHNEFSNQLNGSKTWDGVWREVIVWGIKMFLIAALFGLAFQARHWLLEGVEQPAGIHSKIESPGNGG